MACMRGCIITLVAFVWLFSCVCFQMGPQMACLGGGKFTLVAFMSSVIIIKVVLAKIYIHHFLQFDASSLAAFFQLAQKKRTLDNKTF